MVYNVEKYGRRKLLTPDHLSVLLLRFRNINLDWRHQRYAGYYDSLHPLWWTIGSILWIIIPEMAPNMIRDKLMSWANTLLIWIGEFYRFTDISLCSQTNSPDPHQHLLTAAAFLSVMGHVACWWFYFNLFFVVETKTNHLSNQRRNE